MKTALFTLAVLVVAAGLFVAFGPAEQAGDAQTANVTDTPETNMEESTNTKSSADDALAFTTTESGLKYAIIREGDGETRPTIRDTVTVHYHGTLQDGTVFDSSINRGEPVTFPLQNLITGWQEGIPLMSKGAKYRFVVPPELAYGPEGAGHPLSGKTLTFDVELLEIQ